MSASSSSSYSSLVEKILPIAYQAGEQILQYYQSSYTTQYKLDHSPLTQADMAAHTIIYEQLIELTPEIPVLSEENAADYQTNTRLNWKTYWLVDPLDGTKEFISANGEFTVNIALIHHHRAVLGVVYSPVLRTLYYGGQTIGAFKKIIHPENDAINTRLATNLNFLTDLQANPIRVAVSRSHQNTALISYLDSLDKKTLKPVGSSLKFCLLAENHADIYPRFSPTSEWDTAAGQAIIEAIGGQVITASGSPLRYNQKECLINPPFCAYIHTSTGVKNWITQANLV